MYRCWFAWNIVVHWVKQRPIGFTAWTTITDAAMTIAACALSATPGVDQGLISAGAILAGPVLTLAIRFTVAFFAAPVRHLEIELGREREENYELRAFIAMLLQQTGVSGVATTPDSGATRRTGRH